MTIKNYERIEEKVQIWINKGAAWLIDDHGMRLVYEKRLLFIVKKEDIEL